MARIRDLDRPVAPAVADAISAVCDRDRQLRAENTRLRAALEAVEWIEDCCRIGQYCPWCRRHRASGHTPDCLRQAALGEEPSDGQ